MDTSLWAWVLFHALLFGMLALDLGVFHRRSHAVGLRESLSWSVVWIVLAMLFNLGIYFTSGAEASMQFLTGYVIEKSLSIDNVFVFALIFGYFRVPAAHQHKVLFWGILGALVMRCAFIFAGISLIKQFHGLIYLFGALLVFSGIKMLLSKDAPFDPSSSWIIRIARRVFRVSEQPDGDRFMTRTAAGVAVTPLFLVLFFVEITDVVFAIDSIPAIMAVTMDPFLVYTSNAFAMLGMRSLYFALAGLLPRFVYLHHGLSAILVFVGGKMLLSDFVKVPIGVSLGVITCIIVAAVVASFWRGNATSTHFVEAVPCDGEAFPSIETRSACGISG
jgi:tellurite resistance protein TerC